MNQIGSRTHKHVSRYYKNDIEKKEQKNDTEVVFIQDFSKNISALFLKIISYFQNLWCVFLFILYQFRTKYQCLLSLSH